jgi:hypothetical protein
MGLENNLCCQLNYILHGELAGKYHIVFVTLAKVLTQTVLDETD